jgi:alpha-tubulin suppressor-like RCC1 family protein
VTAALLAIATISAITSVAPATAAVGTSALSTWGANDLGELGTGAATGRTTPGPGPAYSDITSIAGGRDHVLALRANGSVIAWGSNDFGQVGDGTKTNRASPVTVTPLPAATHVYAGHYHSLALTSSGALYSWGDNATGQLGLGDTTSRSRPVQVPVGAPIASADGGEGHTIALGTDGTVWTWGNNAYGEIGDGTTTMRTLPVHVAGLSGVVQVAAARDSSYAITSSGALYSWGLNDSGQLGLGDTVDRSVPTLVPGIPAVRSIAAGAFHVVAIMADGTVRAWGYNSYGNVGDGTTTKRLSPVVVHGLTGATYVECGRDFSFVVTSDGVLHGWGRNDAGQLGDGSTTNRLTPVVIPGITGVTALGAGRDYTAALVSGTPDTQPPTIPGTPSAVSSAPGTVTVSWPASTDNRATTLTYSVFRDGGGSPVGTVSSAATGTVSFADTGLTGGSIHTYQVRASDGTNSSALSPVSNQVTVQAASPTVFSDDFTNGLAGWSSANLAVDQTHFPPTGAAPSVRGATSAAPQWATHSLGGSYSSLCVQADVDLSALSTTPAALLRFTSASAGVARVYLTPARMLALRADGSGQSFTSTTALPVGAWHHLKVCTTVGASATVSVSLDGNQVLSATSSTGTSPITLVQLGDKSNVTMTVNYDNVVVTD